MQKTFEKKNSVVEIETEILPNGISSVACIKSFVKPINNPKTDIKCKGSVIYGVETLSKYIVKEYVNGSDLLSDNHIMDFDCTKNNLNTEKWSRMKTDIYLFTPFVECEGELVLETKVLCEMLCDRIFDTLTVENRFEMTKEVV